MQNSEIHPQLTWTHFESLNSTNTYLLDSKQPCNQLVSADHQTQGRGRRQQVWVDEGNSLLMSLSTEFPVKSNLSAWAIQVAVCLAQTLGSLTEQTIKIKWPNDLYTLTNQYQWGKFAGILIESTLGKTGKMVTGVGINLATFSQQTQLQTDYPVAALTSQYDKRVLIPYLGNALFSTWQTFIAHPEVDPMAYRNYDLLADRLITTTSVNNQQTETGLGAGINRQGQLLLSQPDKTLVITSQQRIRILD